VVKKPVDDLAKIIADAVKASGLNLSPKAIKSAIAAETKSVTRKAPAKVAPKITRQTAAGGAGRKPPKPPKAGPAASAPRPKGPKKNGILGSDADVNKYIMREGRIASQYRKKGGEVSLDEAAMANIYEKGKSSKRKPPASGSPAKKPAPKPKKPSGSAKMTRAERREMNVAKHWAERDKYLAESSAAARAAKAERSAERSAAWAKRQDEMLARRMEGREKYNKKKGNK